MRPKLCNYFQDEQGLHKDPQVLRRDLLLLHQRVGLQIPERPKARRKDVR